MIKIAEKASKPAHYHDLHNVLHRHQVANHQRSAAYAPCADPDSEGLSPLESRLKRHHHQRRAIRSRIVARVRSSFALSTAASAHNRREKARMTRDH